MHGPSRCAMLAAAALLACTRNPAPPGWLPAPEAAASDAFGGWIEVESGDVARPTIVAGELLAVAPDTLWVLATGGPLAVARAGVTRATLAGWDAATHTLTVWTALGALSTISNGAFLVFTAPAWLIGGSLATGAQSRRPLVRVPPATWEDLRLYARFPAGLPPGLDPSALERRAP